MVTLPADDQILITRDFDARGTSSTARGPSPSSSGAGGTQAVAKSQCADIDLRVGGRWRYAMVAHGGDEVAFHGEFREIVPDERLVSTEMYEGAPDHEALSTLTFSADGERTRVTLLVDHGNREVRDMVLQTGMEDGLQDALDLLESVAASLR